LRAGPDDEGTINVASKKMAKPKFHGLLKLKRSLPNKTKPGNWKDGNVGDGACSPFFDRLYFTVAPN
jgi:SAGA-associated factor 73